MTVHIRRSGNGSNAWCAELDSGYLCGTAYSLDDLVTKLAHHSEVVLHLTPTEATRIIDRHIHDYEIEIVRAKRTIRSNTALVKRFRAERLKIVASLAKHHNT